MLKNGKFSGAFKLAWLASISARNLPSSLPAKALSAYFPQVAAFGPITENVISGFFGSNVPRLSVEDLI